MAFSTTLVSRRKLQSLLYDAIVHNYLRYLRHVPSACDGRHDDVLLRTDVPTANLIHRFEINFRYVFGVKTTQVR